MKRLLPDYVNRRLDPAQKYGLRLTLFLFATAVIVIPFSMLLEQVLTKGPLTRLDLRVARDLNDFLFQHQWLVGPLKVISFLGKPAFTVPVIAAVAIYLFLNKVRRLIVYLVSSTVLGSFLDRAVKTVVNRPRPTVHHVFDTGLGRNWSFPSGHSMTAIMAYGAIALIFLPIVPRKGRTPLIVTTLMVVFAIGMSRVFLGVHYATDVLGGYALGLAWLTASTAAFSIWRVERGRKPVEPLHEGVEPESKKKLSPTTG